MKLSIIITIHNDCTLLDKTIKKFCTVIDNSRLKGQIEILCVNRLKTDLAHKIIAEYTKYFSYIQYFAKSSESSYFEAVKFAKGEYVWFFESDALPYSNSIDSLINLLQQNDPEFVLLNAQFKTGDTNIEYIQSFSPVIHFKQGIDLFKIFGLISATTNLSCLCFKRRSIDVEIFLRFNRISEIYSHSFTMLAHFHDKKSIFISTPFLEYNKNTNHNESKCIREFNKTTEDSCFFLSAISVIQLCTAVSKMTEIPLSVIARMEEIEIDTTSSNLKRSLLWCSVSRILYESIKKTNSILSYSITEMEELIDFYHAIGSNISKIFADNISTLHATTLAIVRNSILKNMELYLNKALVEEEENYFSSLKFITPDNALFFQKNISPRPIENGQKTVDTKKIRLSILIPTFARPRILDKTIEKIYNNDLYKVSNVEWVISVNYHAKTELYYHKIAQRWNKLIFNMRFVFHDTHVFSAEESINRSVSLCYGDYIQLCGDDDFIIPTTFYFLQSLLHKSEFDLYIFNSINIANHIELAVSNHSFTGDHPFLKQLEQVSYSDTVKEYGLMTTMSFISRYVFRKSKILDFKDFISISPIYSHVFGFMRSFKNTPSLILDYPLTVRGNSKVITRFKKITEHLNTAALHPWTDGLFKLFKYAFQIRIIEPAFLTAIQEHPNRADHFMLWQEMMIQYLRQYKMYIENFSENNISPHLYTDDFIEFSLKYLSFLNIETHHLILQTLYNINIINLMLKRYHSPPYSMVLILDSDIDKIANSNKTFDIDYTAKNTQTSTIHKIISFDDHVKFYKKIIFSHPAFLMLKKVILNIFIMTPIIVFCKIKFFTNQKKENLLD